MPPMGKVLDPLRKWIGLTSSFPSFPSVGFFRIHWRQAVLARGCHSPASVHGRPLETMDLDGGADDRVAQLIGFVEQWMHELILQKETKETKKEPKPSFSPLKSGLTANVIC